MHKYDKYGSSKLKQEIGISPIMNITVQLDTYFTLHLHFLFQICLANLGVCLKLV